MTAGALIYDVDKKLAVPDCDITTWEDMPWDGPHRFQEPKGVHPRPAGVAVKQIVLHWTASEREGAAGAQRTLESMSARTDAGCHVLTTNGGRNWQFADLLTEQTSHVSHKIVVTKSIGLEVSDYGWVPKGQRIPRAGRGRKRYSAKMQGWTPTMADFYPEQQDSINKMCAAMCTAFGIPLQVMLAPFVTRSDEELEEFEGVLAHCHCALGDHPKNDPGTEPMYGVDAYFKMLRGEEA
jgi:hypothetical protein